MILSSNYINLSKESYPITLMFSHFPQWNEVHYFPRFVDGRWQVIAGLIICEQFHTTDSIRRRHRMSVRKRTHIWFVFDTQHQDTFHSFSMLHGENVAAMEKLWNEVYYGNEVYMAMQARWQCQIKYSIARLQCQLNWLNLIVERTKKRTELKRIMQSPDLVEKIASFYR